MLGMVRLVLGKHVGAWDGNLHPFYLEQIDFPSVVAASSLPAGAERLEYGRGAWGVKVIR